jgi:hypothetical protein
MLGWGSERKQVDGTSSGARKAETPGNATLFEVR